MNHWIKLLGKDGESYSLLNLSTVSLITKKIDHINFKVSESFEVNSYGKNDDFHMLVDKLLGN